MEIKISPLYDVLIYLEDKRRASLDEIQSWGKTVSRGIIGKMEAMGVISKKDVNGYTYFELSKGGYELLDKILDTLHRGVIHWDGKWYIVIFSIPEKNRPLRDRFRRAMEAEGMRPILGSAWITPLDIRARILKTAEDLGIENDILIVESQNQMGLNPDRIVQAWDFEKYRRYYEGFIENANRDITKSEVRNNRLMLKKLIFGYALILNSEPKLPIELMPKDWPRYRANLIYKKIRRLLS